MAHSEKNSPFNTLSNTTALSVLNWLESLDKENRANILLGIGQTEFSKILGLSHDIVTKFFEIFVLPTSGENFFGNRELAELNESAILSAPELSLLKFNDEFK